MSKNLKIYYCTNRKNTPAQGIRQVYDDEAQQISSWKLCGLRPRSECPQPGIGMAVMGPLAQAGAECRSFCLKSARMGQPLLKPPHRAAWEPLPLPPGGRGTTPSCPVSKLALSSGRQSLRVGEDVVRVLTAQLLTHKQATAVKDSAHQIDRFIYLLPAHCKCEVNYFAIAEV